MLITKQQILVDEARTGIKNISMRREYNAAKLRAGAKKTYNSLCKSYKPGFKTPGFKDGGVPIAPKNTIERMKEYMRDRKIPFNEDWREYLLHDKKMLRFFEKAEKNYQKELRQYDEIKLRQKIIRKHRRRQHDIKKRQLDAAKKALAMKPNDEKWKAIVKKLEAKIAFDYFWVKK